MKNLYFILLVFVAMSCSKEHIEVNYFVPTERRINLVVRNSDAAIVGNDTITNMQILVFDEKGSCLRAISNSKVMFDENKIFATTLTIPKSATSVTVLANAIGYTYPSQQLFVGWKLADIFLSATHTANVPSHYYQQPKSFFEGTSLILNGVSDAEVVNVSVDISRVVSKIVIQLANGLEFTDNSGKGFNTINSTQKIYINGIDSIFVIDTPAGINLTETEYMSNAIGFDVCQIYKVADFKPNEKSLLSDDVVVFPQINEPQLPYIILSVTGSKGTQLIGKDNPLYYGMRIKNVTSITGSLTPFTSLPRNVVIVVTVNNFSGVGSASHPNPNYLNTLDVSVDVKSWSDYYNASGNLE